MQSCNYEEKWIITVGWATYLDYIKRWSLYVCKLCINSDKKSFVVCLISLHNSARLVIRHKHLLIPSTVGTSNNVGL